MGPRTSAAAAPASPVVGALSDPFAADRRNEARVRANRNRTFLLATASAAVPAVVLGAVLGGVAGTAAGAVVAVVVLVCVAALVVREALRIALAVIGGHAVREEELPALANQVDGLSATVGVRRPRLWVVEDPVPNACALSGRRDARPVLIVTTGLLELLGIIELEGVLAHELVHMKREDAAASAVAVATAGLVSAAFGGDRVLHRALGRGREYEADQAAALAVRYPPGLRDALVAFGARAASLPASAPSGAPTPAHSPFCGWRWAATRWIWIDPMVGVAGPVERAPIGELDATDVRAEALAQW
jgi:heat shock protein HtpX